VKVGDLVKMKAKRFHKYIGIIKVSGYGGDGLCCLRIYWSDGRQTWEVERNLKVVKKCP
jgi:hypothetical protein